MSSIFEQQPRPWATILRVFDPRVHRAEPPRRLQGRTKRLLIACALGVLACTYVLAEAHASANVNVNASSCALPIPKRLGTADKPAWPLGLRSDQSAVSQFPAFIYTCPIYDAPVSEVPSPAMTMPVSLPDVSFKKYPFCWADMSRNDLSSTVPGHVATYVEASPFYPVLPLYFPGVSLRSDCASSQDIVNSEVIKLPDLSLLLITTIMAVAIKALVVASHAIDDASVLLPILPPIDRIESSDDVRSVATESPLGDLLDGDVRDELEGGLPNDIIHNHDEWLFYDGKNLFFSWIYGVISNESPRILPVVTEPSFSTTSLDDVEEHYCKGELALPMFHYTEEVFAAASGVSPKSQGVLDREVEEAVNLEASKQHMHDNDATLSPTPLRTSRLRRSPVLSQRGLEYTADQAIKFERLARLRAKRAARSEPPKTSEPFSPPRTRSKTVPPTQAIPRERRATAKPLKSRK